MLGKVRYKETSVGAKSPSGGILHSDLLPQINVTMENKKNIKYTHTSKQLRSPRRKNKTKNAHSSRKIVQKIYIATVKPCAICLQIEVSPPPQFFPSCKVPKLTAQYRFVSLLLTNRFKFYANYQSASHVFKCIEWKNKIKKRDWSQNKRRKSKKSH